MNKHIFRECTCGDCYFCRTELADCVKCGGFEGTLPTECPQVIMTEGQENAVYARKIDFIGGEWINKNDK